MTLRKFFAFVHHPKRGWVPTYGGPFDSYTIPEPVNLPPEDGDDFELHHVEFEYERYDHDQGAWVEWGDPCIGIIHETALFELEGEAEGAP